MAQGQLLVADFSAGITDNYISAPTSSMQKCDNFDIVYHGRTGKLSSRYGSQIYDEDFPRIPNNGRINQLFKFENKIIAISGRNLYFLDTGGWTEIVGPTSNKLFPATSSDTNVITYSKWNRHVFITNDDLSSMPSKLYPDGSNNLTLRTAGLPQLASLSGVHATAGTTTSYLYRVVYHYSYTVDTVLYEDFGPTRQIQVQGATAIAAGAGNTVTLTLPTLANGATLNYDTTNIKQKIYRTIDNGTTFFYVGEVTNGAGTFADNVTDATLLANGILLYTEGGILDNDSPLPSKIVHIARDITYYAHVKDGSEIFENRVMQAAASDPDSVPGANFVDVDEPIVGFSSVKAFGIALCDNSAYRIEGLFDDLGRGGMFAFKISDTCSCISAQSVVQTLEGVFWAGKDAFYFTDGYRVIKINEDWAETYSMFVSTEAKQKLIQGKYDSFNRRIAWCVKEDDSSTDVDKLYILHLRSGVSENSAFTSRSNGVYFSPTSFEFDGDSLLRGDRRGYVFVHTADINTDPKIDTTTGVSNWNTVYIPWDYKGSAMDFGTTLERKYATSMILTCENSSNVSIQIKSNNDENKNLTDLKQIRFRGNIVWGDPNIIWGDPNLVWNQRGLIEERRWFPKTSLRFSYKQVQITNAFVAIYNSDTLGPAVVDNVAKTATLVEAASFDWPTDIVDYYISFEVDGYQREYLISERTSADVLTYTDANDDSANAASSKWVIRGYPKNEKLDILSYTIGYLVFGDTQKGFSRSESGEVA